MTTSTFHLLLVVAVASTINGAPVDQTTSGFSEQPPTGGVCDTTRRNQNQARDACEGRSLLTCTENGQIEVCDWETMQPRYVDCVYNAKAGRCEEERPRPYSMGAPCEIHVDKTSCEGASSPESLDYATRRNCAWHESSKACRSPVPAYFYMLTKEGLVFRVDPFQKKLEYVYNKTGATALAADPNHPGGIYVAHKNAKNDDVVARVSNIERGAGRSSERVYAKMPATENGLGENNEGALLTTLPAPRHGDNPKLAIYDAGRKGDVTAWKERSNGCGRKMEGDIAIEPSTSVTGKNRVVTASSGRILDVLNCQRYNWIIGDIEGLAFTCNGDLYAGADNRIYKIDVSKEKSEPIMTLGGSHDILDFASQPGCHVISRDCKKRSSRRR